jgi:hypothetical protein
MLTIKHVSPGDNGDSIYPGVIGTHFYPLGRSDGKAVLVAHQADRQQTFEIGTVYVMNEAGATVGTYRLPNLMPPPTEKKPPSEIHPGGAPEPLEVRGGPFTKLQEEWTS